MTLGSKGNVKSESMDMQTPLAYFNGGYLYLTQCLPEMCYRKAF